MLARAVSRSHSSGARTRHSGAGHSQSALPTALDLNAATAAELELLPDIGPALAQRIVDYRTKHGPFKTIEGLDAVSGIGQKTLAKVRPLLFVLPHDASMRPARLMTSSSWRPS